MSHDPLIMSRQCAVIIHQICDAIGLGSMAERFSGEDPNLWVIVDAIEVRLVSSRRLVATFYLEDTAEVVIPDATNLIRSQHLSEFDPDEYDILPRPPPDVLGNQAPQLHIESIPIPDPATLLQGPRQYVPTTQHTRKLKTRRHYSPG
jgi:hypothetical protein